MGKILYASDLDRTLIYSGRFLESNPCDDTYYPVEQKDDKIISYMAHRVANKLHDVANKDDITFVPVTTRTLEEFNRIELPVKPEYVICSNGGTILHNGEPIKEWSDYVRNSFNHMEAMEIVSYIEDTFHSVDYTPKLRDGCFIFLKVRDRELYDKEVMILSEKFTNWDFVRQSGKAYAIPKHFSKQIALRWLWHRLEKPYIVASGDSQLDLPMLTLANKAVIPSHGVLVTEGYVVEGNIIDGGILSPLKTMEMVEDAAKEK